MVRRRQAGAAGEQEQPRLTVPRDQFTAELEDRIAGGREIAARSVDTPDALKAANAKYFLWDDYNITLLKQRFTTTEIADSYRWWGMASIGPYTFSQEREAFERDIESKLHRLESVKQRIPLYSEPPREPVVVAQRSAGARDGRSVFIVHGHDERRKLAVHGFLREVTALDIIVLHDQADRGRTIIEKFEDHAGDARFAAIVLTGDDVGGPNAEQLHTRARQNVVFEFGFFCGGLGRNRVAILYEEGVELPSDVNGLLYIPLDEGGAWKVRLARELRAAGLEVDANKLL